jgi:hypothetical protein
LATTTNTAIFHGHPITIERGRRNNASIVTINGDQINELTYATQLLEETKLWCQEVKSSHGREAEARLENDEIICSLDVPVTRGNDTVSLEDVLPKLVRRLNDQQGRAMRAGAGGSGGGPVTGEEDLEEVRRT